MARLVFLAGALALLAACDGGDGRRDPPPDPGDGEPQPGPPPAPPASDPSAPPAGTLSPPVLAEGSPRPAPECALSLADDPPDLAAGPAVALAAAWELAPPAGWTLTFDGVTDADGNLYWHEWRVEGGPGAAIASASRDGVLRWRTELDADGARAWLVAGARVVVAAGDGSEFPARLAALDAASGEVVWTLEVAPAVEPLVPAARGPMREGVRVDHPAVLDGVVTFPVATVDAPGYVWPGFLRVDLATGAVHELRAIAADLTIWIASEPVVTGGRAFADVRPTESSVALLGFDGDGSPALAVPLRFEENPWTLAASERFLFDAGFTGAGEAPFLQWSALDGTPLGRISTSWYPPDVLSGGATAFVHGGGRLARVDLDGCAVAWARTLARAPAGERYIFYLLARTAPIRTRRGVLLALQVQRADTLSGETEGEAAWLLEVGAGGADAFRARLPDGFLWGGGATLHRGRFVTAAATRPWEARLVAFDVGDREPAAEGWVARHGGPSRERRAAP